MNYIAANNHLEKDDFFTTNQPIKAKELSVIAIAGILFKAVRRGAWLCVNALLKLARNPLQKCEELSS